MKLFTINSSVAEKFGPIKVGYLFINNVTIFKTPPREKKIAREVEARIREDFKSKNYLEDDRIKSWLYLAEKMGISDEERLPSHIGLIKKILSGKDIPKINCIVDAANIISAKHFCPVGIFDSNALSGNVTLRTSEYGESYIPLFSDNPVDIGKGEIVYADAIGIFSRYCKDADRTKVTEKTTSLFCVVDGTSDTSQENLEIVLNDLSNLIIEVCGPIEITSGFIVAY